MIKKYPFSGKFERLNNDKEVKFILDEIKRVKDEKVVDLRFENYLIEEEVEEDSVSE